MAPATRRKKGMPGLMPLDHKIIRRFGSNVVGVDEVGMGAFAGPICACAISIDLKGLRYINHKDARVNDSKLLTRKQREILHHRITSVAGCALGWVSAAEIDQMQNLYAAGQEARIRAVDLLLTFSPCGVILSDYYSIKIPDKIIPCVAVPHADAKSFIVACASIVAKYARDQVMTAYHSSCPEYGWDTNVGYGTKKHIAAIRKHGLTSLHRKYICKAYERSHK